MPTLNRTHRIMGYRKSLVVVALAIALLACLNLVWRFVWISFPLTGRVVEASTGQPVAKAIVVANWTIRGLESASVRELAVREAVTDKNGAFRMAGWGPRFQFGFGGLEEDVPVVRVFKRGYVPVVDSNSWQEGAFYRARSVLRTLPMKIRLQKFDGTLEGYAIELAPLAMSLWFAYDGRGCYWRLLPRMMVALHWLRAEMDFRQIHGPLLLLSQTGGKAKCGDAEVLLQEESP